MSHSNTSSYSGSGSEQAETEAIAACKRIRANIVRALHATGGGHYGGSLSVVEILYALYSARTASAFHNSISDKIILSKGHAAVALYAIFEEFKLISPNMLNSYGKFAAGLEGHPDMRCTPNVDFSSGSLGQGLAIGIGMAIAMARINRRAWVILGDGECQEGQIWEAALLASRLRIGNLVAIVDLNGSQEYGYKYNPRLCQEPVPQMAEKWIAFGWRVIEADGHALCSLQSAIQSVLEPYYAPSVILAHTKKGAGVTLFENHPTKYHCAVLSENEYITVLEALQ